MSNQANRYNTVRYADPAGNVHETGLYMTHADSWQATIARAERLLKLQLGASNVARVVWLNGNAA